ncbi:hypothetical protein MRX96_001655 [Rhipicephalus microplus]
MTRRAGGRGNAPHSGFGHGIGCDKRRGAAPTEHALLLEAMANIFRGGPTRAPTPLLSSAPHDCLFSRALQRLKLRQLAYTMGLRITEAPGATPPPRYTSGSQKQLRRGHSSTPEVIHRRCVPEKLSRTRV